MSATCEQFTIDEKADKSDTNDEDDAEDENDTGVTTSPVVGASRDYVGVASDEGVVEGGHYGGGGGGGADCIDTSCQVSLWIAVEREAADNGQE